MSPSFKTLSGAIPCSLLMLEQLKIRGAVNINVLENSFITKAEKNLSKSKPVAVYCRSGKRSLNAAQQLIKAGFTVVDLKGGIIGWTTAGFPISKE